MLARVPVSREEAPAFVCDLLEKRTTLERAELSARWVARQLGQTTGFLYHHWGSFDAFLLEVSGVGWGRLVAEMRRAYDAKETIEAIFEAYLDFALGKPVLYWLIAERPLPVEVVRGLLERGEPLPSYPGFIEMTTLLVRAMPGFTITRARALHAAAHGLVSQLLSHRLGSMPDTFRRDERDVANEIAREIARMFTPPRTKRSPDRDPTAGSRSRPRRTPRRKSSA